MSSRVRRAASDPAFVSERVSAVEPGFLRARDIEAYTGLSHGKVSALMNTSTAFGGLPVREIAGVRGVLLSDLREWLRAFPVVN